MSKINLLIILNILIPLILLVNTKEVEPIKIPINSYNDLIELTTDNSLNNYFVIEYEENDIKNNNYLTIYTYTYSLYDKNAFIYVSFTEKNPSADKRDYVSQLLEKNEIIINVSKLKGKNKLYINIHSLKETKVNFGLYLSENIELNSNNNKKRFKLSDVNKVIYKLEEKYNNKKIMFYSVGENINYFSMNIKGINTNIEYQSQQKFDNGYGIIIDLNKIQETIFEINIILNELYPGINPYEKEIELGYDNTEQGDNDIKNINIMEHINGYITEKENCYSIKNINPNLGQITTLLINTYSQSLNFVLYREPLYSIDIFNNYYIKLPSEYFQDNYFCLKKYTSPEKTTEEFGEISYDFQIYYEQDLSNVQSFLYPLSNGKIYTYSLNSNDIMLYRHSSFNQYNFLYSVSMTVHRGKPVLYGYECDTYPNCNLNKDKFDILKKQGKIDFVQRINNYYINNKLNALGNKEINAENMSQARKQYLSVVICESSEDLPNKGECQYNIEISNYNDEILLKPDLVFANTILFDKNYFRIKLDNYKEITYLKIFLTIISGNANIDIYSDKAYKNKIANYNYRYAHRKEIIEITENILNNYYIIITTEDSAFIELKYITNTNYKGYNKLNPNEVNIEYINKNQGFTPYSVINPNYLYPINNPKNNNFYIHIMPLDCSITYKYNFHDENNLTSIYYQINKDDINYASSYGFEIKLENYFHTILGNNEDCAMIISAGEQSQNEPLLIFEDYFHPSNFIDTYYIYPFSISDNFKGVLIQIQFDKESIIKINKINQVSITFKIANQYSDYEKYIISEDSTFFISEQKIKKYCKDKFYLCSLIIEINKDKENSLEDNSYTILTNVHSSFDSVEYILKNKVYNYNLRSYEQKYFYTQIDQNEQGEINFIFNKGNSKVYAKLSEKNTIEENPNWNRRIKLPSPESNDLLYYDSLNNIIKYDSKEKNNCIKGCELYMLILNDQGNNNDTLLSEVSFNINKKDNSVIDIPYLNKYIKGNLEKDKYKYYTITIPYDYYKISFNLYSSHGKAYIKLGKGHICNKDNSLWELNPKDEFGRIIIEANDKNIKKNSLKGISFSIGIINKEEIVDNKLFYLEIQGLYNNIIPYYHLSSERSIICDINDNKFCHVLLYINHNYNNNKNLLYAYPYNDDIKIFVKYYSEINEQNYHNSIENLFPNEIKYDKKTEKGKNFIFLNTENILDKNSDLYILITIYSDIINNKIKLVSNTLDITKALLTFGTDELFYLNKNNIKFELPYDTNNNINYLMNIKTIKGTQELVINNGEIISDLNGNYYIELKSNPSEKSFDIINLKESEDEQGIIINYKEMKNDKLFYLEKNIKNEIILSLSNDNNLLPQYAYTKLNYNFSTKIEILFHDITYDKNKNNNEDNFDIKAYIINRDILNKIKKEPKIKIEGEEIKGEYLIYEKTSLIYISKDKIKNDDEYYLYIIINKSTENKNIYKTIKFQYSINEEEKGLQPYQNKFYFSSINNINKEDYYIINKQSNSDKYIIIDFAENIPVLNNFEIKKELFKDNAYKLNENSKENLIQEFDYNGRKRIIVELKNYDGIKLNIKQKSDDVKNKYYSINYNFVNNLTNFENFTKFNDTIFISSDSNNKSRTNLTFNNIVRQRRSSRAKSFNYYLDIFQPKDELKQKSNIYTTYIGNRDEKNIIYGNILNNKNIFSRNVTIELNMTKDELKSYYIRLLADIFYSDGTRQKYIYNMTLIDIDKKSAISNIGTKMAIYIFIFVPITSIAVVIAVMIYIKKKNKENDINDDIENDSLLPKDNN